MVEKNQIICCILNYKLVSTFYLSAHYYKILSLKPLFYVHIVRMFLYCNNLATFLQDLRRHAKIGRKLGLFIRNHGSADYNVVVCIDV